MRWLVIAVPPKRRISACVGCVSDVLLPPMLDVWRHGDPFVFALLIHRHFGCRERRVRERTNRDCDQVWLFFQVVVDRRTTGRAEMVRDLVATVTGANVLPEPPLTHHAYARE